MKYSNPYITGQYNPLYKTTNLGPLEHCSIGHCDPRNANSNYSDLFTLKKYFGGVSCPWRFSRDLFGASGNLFGNPVWKLLRRQKKTGKMQYLCQPLQQKFWAKSWVFEIYMMFQIHYLNCPSVWACDRTKTANVTNVVLQMIRMSSFNHGHVFGVFFLTQK